MPSFRFALRSLPSTSAIADNIFLLGTMALQFESTSPAHAVRICQVSGRFLVFEPEAAALLRRKDRISGTLVGTTPLQPSQNIFLGLPIEIRPEEADALVRLGAACVLDIATAHRRVLTHRSDNVASRMTYTEFLRRCKQDAKEALGQRNARKAAEVAERLGRVRRCRNVTSPSSEAKQAASLITADTRLKHPPSKTEACVSITVACSNHLLPALSGPQGRILGKMEGPLCRFLKRGGYYTTPGLRFGAQYSVYPDDPLRFHAHFMANQYAWDDEIAILDVVSAGRLATAVKKAFLFGGRQPHSGTPAVYTFSLEWAAM